MVNDENTHAREWDLYNKKNQESGSSSGSWKVVIGSKTARRQQSRQQLGNRNAITSQKQPHQQFEQLRLWDNNRTQRQGQRFQRFPQKQTNPFVGWQGVNGADRREKQNSAAPNIVIDADNEAQLAWRNHEEPVDSIRIPKEVVFRQNRHEAIAKSHGAFVFSKSSESSGASVTFDIWGSIEATKATKREINEWIDAIAGALLSKRPRTPNLARLQSMTETRLKHEEKKLKKELARQEFRRMPRPGMRFGAIGSFHWPVAEHSPEDVLGLGYEALDPIRMEYHCYVLFNKEKAIFQVSGSSENVPKVLSRLRQTCFQIAARQIQADRLYVLHWTDASGPCGQVALVPYRHPRYITKTGNVQEMEDSVSPRGKGIRPCTKDEITENAMNEELVRNSIVEKLKKLHYYHGGLKMRIHLGTFIATSYMSTEGNTYNFSEFKAMMNESQFEGKVTMPLRNKSAEESLLFNIQNSKGLFLPRDCREESLQDVQPTYLVTFIFEEKNLGNLLLVMSWAPVQDELGDSVHFGIKSKKWSRLDRDADTTSALVDTSLIELSTGSAWQFNIQATKPVDDARLTPALLDFPDSVRLNSDAIQKQSTTKSFVIFRDIGVKLKSVHQRTIYTFGLRDSDYALELVRFQDREYDSSKPNFLSGTQPSVTEPRWSVDVYRTEWDTILGQNERLTVGERAEWPDNVDEWFPEDITATSEEKSSGAGFSQLIKKLTGIKTVVCGSQKSEDPPDCSGEMTVDEEPSLLLF